MRTFTVTICKFDELSPSAQAQAILNERYRWKLPDWSDKKIARAIKEGRFEYTSAGWRWESTMEFV